MSYLSSQKHTTQDLLFLIPFSLFFLVFRLGSGSLASWDEGIYASVAKELLQSGDWLRFTLNHSLWFDKPPLAIWITAFFYKVFGVNEFSARLFSALCGVGTVGVTYFLGRQLLNRWTGFIGALILVSSSHFIRFARFGMTDAPLTFFMTLALYFFWLGHSKNRYLIFSGIAMGLAVMTKGFAAMLVFPVIWLYCLFSGRLSILTRSSYWIGVMIAVVIALPWHLYQMTMHQHVFLQDSVLRHLVERTTKAIEGHEGNAYYYIRVLVNKFHPWILIAIFTAPYFLFRAIKDREDEIIFLSVWIFFILAVITAVRTKLPWYVLPVYPALSLTAAHFLSKIFKENSSLFVKMMFLVVMALHVFYSHIFNADYSRDIKGIASSAASAVPQDSPIFLYNYHESPATTFYINRKPMYADTREVFLRQAAENGFYCLVHADDLESLTGGDLSKYGLSQLASFENLRLVAKIPPH